MSRKKTTKLEFDQLRMYFGKPLTIECPSENNLTVKIPKIGNIIEVGEKEFYKTLNIFITNTTSYKLALWDKGIDWNEFSDFELFCLLYSEINNDVSKYLFDCDFSKFMFYQKNLPVIKEIKNETTGEIETIEEIEKTIILYDKENDIEINNDVHNYFAQFLRQVFNMIPEEKFTKQQYMKELLIDGERRKLRNAEYKKEKDGESNFSIQSLISTCVNHPGFKYKLSELGEVNICEFYDSVRRLQIYESSRACLGGLYSGMVDGSKIPAESYDFFRKI